MEADLKRAGLTSYETKVYITLLSEGILKGGELSKKSRVPQGRTYEVLRQLVEKGFVQELKTSPKLFKSVAPRIAILVFLSKKRKELDILEKTLFEQLRARNDDKQQSRTDEKITLLRGKDVIEPIIKQELEHVKKYFKRMFTFEYLPYGLLREERNLMKKGIKFKLLGTLWNKETASAMRKATKYGYEVRYYPVEELRISIVDGENSFINLVGKNAHDRTVLLVESKELTKALEHYFDAIWEKAKRVK